ncbi:hypothetical protein [Glycomyces sp. NRRL B-16210]|uniref:hypothetical protein n=1 Tax=Glycomyces sp. NRRL B-16210 TaxID=1463821 RepID=UPI00068F7449|nr:hypothetical protein [Glycomyces sp. NRRL B-16210]
MRDYTVTFIESVDLEALAGAAAEAFTMPREQIEVWDGQGFAGAVAEPVLAQVAAGSGPGAFAEFVGFDAFAHHTGAPDHLTVAIALATRVQKRAIFPPESLEDYQWTLVAADGSHGQVVLDSDLLDEGTISIVGAVEPIAGASDLRVIGAEGL